MSWAATVSRSKNIWLWNERERQGYQTWPGYWYVWHEVWNPLPVGYFSQQDALSFVGQAASECPSPGCLWYIRKSPPQ